MVARINKAATEGTHRAKVEQIERELAESRLGEYSPLQLRGWSSGDLRFASAAYHAVVFMSAAALAPRALPTMRRIVSELEQRGEDVGEPLRALYKSYVLAREFAGARALVARYPTLSGLELVPPIVPTVGMPETVSATTAEASSRATWRLTSEAALARTNRAIPNGFFVVAIVAPQCHFSTRAMNAIVRDAELGSIFANAIWLVPPAESLDTALVQQWNTANPRYQFEHVNSVSEWPEVEYWDTPQFYFLANGRVIDTVVGWPREGRKNALRAASEKTNAVLNNR